MVKRGIEDEQESGEDLGREGFESSQEEQRMGPELDHRAKPLS